ncbi:MAG: PAC2 family protein [Candidatus Omnitrophica bacterium]|nr:PAC2 family protein [Candidatus Omnitrophota bacterium]
MIKFTRKVKLKSPIFIAAWPGMGNVAIKCATYLKDSLHAEEFAILDTADLFYPDEALVKEGIIQVPYFPKGKFYYWKNKLGRNDLIIFISESQPSADKGYFYTHKIMEVAESFQVKKVFTFAAMPAPIEHTQKSNVWFAATDRAFCLDLKRFKAKRMDTGQISGLNGLLLSIVRERGQRGVCLLGEVPLYTIQIDNLKASLAILEIFTKVLGIRINLDELRIQAQLQEEEMNRLIEYFRGGSEHKETISEEEIERIKKSLQFYTKLPNSVKERIEKLFEVVKKDISKANELKCELDKWSIYKDYEDRFLDLFKDRKRSSNQ